MSRLLKQIMPLADWLPKYQKSFFAKDFAGGLAAGVLLVPQGMAYSLVAGLPLIHGLYSSLLPPIVYGMFGTSRVLSVAPTAIMSLLTYEAVDEISHSSEQPTTEARVLALSMTLALLTGAAQLLLGLLRAGVAVNFLSKPVLVGFTSAASILIGVGQLKHVFRLDVTKGAPWHENLAEIAVHLGEAHVPSLLLALGCMAIALLFKQWKKGKKALQIIPKIIPGALVVVIFSTAVSYGMGGDEAGFKVVGTVPSGLPSLSASFLGQVSSEDVVALLPRALVLALVGFLESISIALKYANQGGYAVRGNQELVALGLACAAGSLVGGYPVTGGLSRTAVVAQAGSASPLASVLAGLFIMLALAFLSPLFTYLPNPALGALVLLAVRNLFEWHDALLIWRAQRRDALPMLACFGVTLALGVEMGMVAGILMSLIALVYQASFPHWATLGRLQGNVRAFRNIKRFPEAQQIDGIAIFRFDARLFFANSTRFKELLSQHVLSTRSKTSARAVVVIVDFSGVNGIDSTAATMLHTSAAQLRERRQRQQQHGWEEWDKPGFLLLSCVKGPVRDALRRTGVLKLLIVQLNELATLFGDDAATTTAEDVGHFLTNHSAVSFASTVILGRPVAAAETHAGKEQQSAPVAGEAVSVRPGAADVAVAVDASSPASPATGTPAAVGSDSVSLHLS